MYRLKKIYCFGIGLVIWATLIVNSSYAIDGADACLIDGVSDNYFCQNLTENGEADLMKTIGDALNTVYFWVGIVAVIFIIAGGILLALSQGDPQKAQRARRSISGAVVGLTICLMAFAITSFVTSALRGEVVGSGATPIATNRPNDIVNQGTGSDSDAGAGGSNDKAKPTALVTVSHTSLEVGASTVLKTLVVPSSAIDKSLKYTSSNPDIFKVNKDGKITAVKEGQGVLSVETSNGIRKNIAIEIIKPVEAEKVELNKNGTVSLKKNERLQLSAKVIPNNTKDKTVSWESSNSNYVSVSNKGVVKALKETESLNGGTVKIKVKTVNGKSDSVLIKVKDSEKAINVDQNLINHLDSHYNQVGNSFSGYVLSCSGRTVAASSCGASTYMAGRYALTKKDTNYVNFVEQGCQTGFMNRMGGASWNIMTQNRKADYERWYGITGKNIANNWDSYVAALKKGHVVGIMVQGTGGFRVTSHWGQHFVLVLSYRENNGGEIYVWNPTNINQGWHNKSRFTDYAINRNAGIHYEMWKK